MPERKIRMDTQEILLQFKNGQMSLEEAEGYLKRQPFEEMGYAKLDSHRKLRSGFAEVIFCSRKADAHLLEIFRRLYEEEGEVLGTRASQHQYELLKKEFPQVQYDEISHIIKIEKRERRESGRLRYVRQGRQIYRWRKRPLRQRNSSAPMWTASMMWE